MNLLAVYMDLQILQCTLCDHKSDLGRSCNRSGVPERGLLGGEAVHDGCAEDLGTVLLRHQAHHVLHLLRGEEAAEVEV